MKLYSKIVETDTELYNLYVQDTFLKHTDLTLKHEVFEENGQLHIEQKSIYASGMHICESVIKAHEDISNDFATDGPHIRFFFYLKGHSDVRNGAGGQDYQHDIGVLQRNFLDTDGSGGIVSIEKGDEIHHIVVKVSRAFYLNLLDEEPWIKDDVFHKYILSDRPQNRPNEFINMNVNMVNTLQNILNSKHIINNRYHYIKIKLRELLFYIHQETTYGHNFVNEISDSMLHTLESIKAFLSVNFTTPPTIGQLAKDFKVNEKKLKQYFKYVYGVTIYSFVIQVRMAKAKVFLQEGHNINELAELLGYQNVSHFIKVFKKYYGDTPKKMFRKLEHH